VETSNVNRNEECHSNSCITLNSVPTLAAPGLSDGQALRRHGPSQSALVSPRVRG
jgi:hypothetical protein